MHVIVCYICRTMDYCNKILPFLVDCNCSRSTERKPRQPITHMEQRNSHWRNSIGHTNPGDHLWTCLPSILKFEIITRWSHLGIAPMGKTLTRANKGSWWHDQTRHCRENVISFDNLFKFLFSIGGIVFVWVKLQSHFSIRFLNFRCIRSSIYAKYFVVIFYHCNSVWIYNMYSSFNTLS